MDRQVTFCDFCGSPDLLLMYPTDAAGIDWYACAKCADLIEAEAWDRLEAWCATAHHRAAALSTYEARLLERQAHALVKAFRECFLIPVC